jgi:hypothetical protein
MTPLGLAVASGARRALGWLVRPARQTLEELVGTAWPDGEDGVPLYPSV